MVRRIKNADQQKNTDCARLFGVPNRRAESVRLCACESPPHNHRATMSKAPTPPKWTPEQIAVMEEHATRMSVLAGPLRRAGLYAARVGRVPKAMSRRGLLPLTPWELQKNEQGVRLASKFASADFVLDLSSPVDDFFAALEPNDFEELLALLIHIKGKFDRAFSGCGPAGFEASILAHVEGVHGACVCELPQSLLDDPGDIQLAMHVRPGKQLPIIEASVQNSVSYYVMFAPGGAIVPKIARDTTGATRISIEL